MSSLLRGCLQHIRQHRMCSHAMCPNAAVLPTIRLCQTHADAICDSSGRIKPEPVRTKRREVFRAVFYIGIVMDDIDQLLEEADQLYNKKVKPSLSKSDKCSDPKLASGAKEKLLDDVSSLLEELDQINSKNHNQSILSKNEVANDKKTIPSRLGTGVRRQCSPVLLSGPMSSRGLSSISSPRACDNLLCLSCNIPVVALDNLQWDSSTDYLFLRNNIPNVSKLRAKLKIRKGCRAYACQCQWRNISDVIEVRESNVQWICRKHAQ